MHGTLTSILTIIISLISYNALAQSENIVPLPPPPKSKEFSISSSSLSWTPSMVAVIICLISAFCVIGCFSVYLRKCSEQRFINDLVTDDDDVDINNNGSRSRRRRRRRGAAIVRGLDPTVIDTFPMFLYADVKDLKLGNNKGGLECAVCLNEFEDEETLRLLPQCSHVFHPDCIDAWLASHVTCPVCRADLMIITTAFSHDSLSYHLWSQPLGLPHHEVISTSSSSFFRPDIDIEMISSTPASRTAAPKSNTPRITVDENFHNRSHSMGQLLLVRPVEDCERFTLRLPEEVKSQLMKSELSRAKSCVVLPRVKSSRKGGGYRSRSSSSSNYYDREFRSSDRWRGFTVAAPPFFSRGSSTRSFSSSSKKNVEVELEEKTVNTRNNFLFKSVKNPFDRLFGHAAEKEDNGGERSFNRLTGESSV